MKPDVLLQCVYLCLFVDQGSGAADAGGQRQASVSSPGSGALQGAEEQSFTCQVQQSLQRI